VGIRRKRVGRGVGVLVVLQRMWVLRGVFAPKKEKVAGRQRTCVMRKFIICTPHQLLQGRTNQDNSDGKVV